VTGVAGNHDAFGRFLVVGSMRYRSAVTEFIDQVALTHLGPAETRLASALARPRAIAVACVIALTAAGWGALALYASNADLWSALCRAAIPGETSAVPLLLLMWIAMVLAMMLPTAGPMILTYSEIADTAAHQGLRVVSPLVLTAGYLIAWFGFAAIATVLQIALVRTGLLSSGQSGPLLAASIAIIAGSYQFSALKRACLSKCQRPFPYFFANWTETTRGVFALGMRQGMYCVGCCWAMMLLMLAAGAMNMMWMAGLGILMTLEKMTSTRRFSHALGAGLLISGVTIMIAHSFGWSGA
jgi:predicted metal-binding membrane protein